MKMNKISHVLLFVSVVLFSACSNSQPKVAQVSPIKVKASENYCTLDLDALGTHQFRKSVNQANANIAPMSENKTFDEKWEPFTVADEIEWNAKELLGKKYVWGATGPRTYDCSGFTQKLYRDVGIKLPRVSRQQAKKGEYVRFENLKKGDLVFFDTKRKGKRRVTHVGIYLGNGDFIHASSGAKKVVICNFKKKCFYKKCFLWGRRVIQPKQYVASLK